jgi:hypothetical protein
MNKKMLTTLSVLVLTLAAIPATVTGLAENNIGSALGMFVPVMVLGSTVLGIPLYLIINRSQQAQKSQPPDPLSPEQHLQIAKNIPSLLFLWGAAGAANTIFGLATVNQRTALFWIFDLLSALIVIGLGFLVRRRSAAALIAATLVIGLNHAIGLYRSVAATGVGWLWLISAGFALVAISILVQAIRSIRFVNQLDSFPRA